jgi:hypothetical protein
MLNNFCIKTFLVCYYPYMPETKHLYLNTLEIEPLGVGGSYNPLPAHLTLMSRYWSELQPNQIFTTLKPTFEQVGELTLRIGDREIIGPQQTPVHLIIPSTQLTDLHNQLKQQLDELCVTYAYPQFVGQGWKPHVSYRQESEYKPGAAQHCGAAYLIEVTNSTDGDMRHIRSKFSMQP